MGQRLLTANDKVQRVGQERNIQSLAAVTIHLLFFKIYKRGIKCAGSVALLRALIDTAIVLSMLMLSLIFCDSMWSFRAEANLWWFIIMFISILLGNPIIRGEGQNPFNQLNTPYVNAHTKPIIYFD